MEAFPWDEAPTYLIRDRDEVYGSCFQKRVQGLGIEEVLIAPKSPWQNPYAERVIGSIRRECLDHVIVLSERHLKRTLTSYLDYYHRWRTHLSLNMDAPEHRPVQPPELGEVVECSDACGVDFSNQWNKTNGSPDTTAAEIAGSDNSRCPTLSCPPIPAILMTILGTTLVSSDAQNE